MKRLVIVAFLAVLSVVAYTDTVYFGYCDAAGTGTGAESIATSTSIEMATAGYACPGSGAQTVVSIGAEMAGSGANIRVGLYIAGGAAGPEGDVLVVEADAEAAASAAWIEWSSAHLTWHNGYTTLTGGTTYIIAITYDGSAPVLGTTGLPGNTLSYASVDYTAGMPDPMPAVNGYTYEANLRIGVVSAAASIIPQLMHYRREQ